MRGMGTLEARGECYTGDRRPSQRDAFSAKVMAGETGWEVRRLGRLSRLVLRGWALSGWWCYTELFKYRSADTKGSATALIGLRLTAMVDDDSPVVEGRACGYPVTCARARWPMVGPRPHPLSPLRLGTGLARPLDVPMPARVEHVRHARPVPCLPAPVARDTMSALQGNVAPRRLVRGGTQALVLKAAGHLRHAAQY